MSPTDGARAGDPLAPYRELVALAEFECSLLQAGRFEELAAADLEWNAARERLPEVPPADAAPMLRRALGLAQQFETALRASGRVLQAEMGHVDHGRAVGRAYAPAGSGHIAGAIDTAA